jgi:hypothetical protein
MLCEARSTPKAGSNPSQSFGVSWCRLFNPRSFIESTQMERQILFAVNASSRLPHPRGKWNLNAPRTIIGAIHTGWSTCKRLPRIAGAGTEANSKCVYRAVLPSHPFRLPRRAKKVRLGRGDHSHCGTALNTKSRRLGMFIAVDRRHPATQDAMKSTPSFTPAS